MKKIVFSFLFCGALIFGVQSCGGEKQSDRVVDSTQGPPPPPSPAEAIGQSIYLQKCTMCHGEDGTAGTMGAKDLSESKIDHPATVLMIKTGKNSMKAYSPELNDKQIDAVATYIETFRK